MIAIKRWWMVLLAFVLLALTMPLMVPVNAQDGNLLQDPSFEGPYVNRGRATLNTPAPWPIWLQDGPHGFDWQNRADKVTAFPHNGGPEVHSGAHSLNLDGGYVTYTAAVYQTVSVPPNTNLTGSAWARIKTCNIAPHADNCGSAVESGAFVKVGIDPNGGTDPNSPSIVWSANFGPHDTYMQGTVSATSGAGGTATLFIYTTQTSPAQLNKAWFDDAYLGTGGAGGFAPGQATPVPTARPVPTAFVAIVQPTRPDGSIIHVVQVGDTLTGISTAYGVSIDTIMQLNSLRSSRYIFVGQQLLIKPPTGTSGGTTTGSGDLFSQSDLDSLNKTPGPTPVGMQLNSNAPAAPTATFAG